MDNIDEEVFTPAEPLSRSLSVRATDCLEYFVHDINWLHVAFKLCAYSYLSLIAWMVWQILPIAGHWDRGRYSDKVPVAYQNLQGYFDTFTGFPKCGITVAELYTTTSRDGRGNAGLNHFCPDRKSVLQAMSDGGRIGFDAPYLSRGCLYRWYSVAEMCMILERFGSLMFVGDSTLQSIFNGFNILLRQDLAYGALQDWKMKPDEKVNCECNNQFTNANCAQSFITSSEQVSKGMQQSTKEHERGYFCERTPFAFVHFAETGLERAGQAVASKLDQLVPKAGKSSHKPIPIIHSLSPTTASHKVASTFLLDVLKFTDQLERQTPILWIGPTAAGHVEIKGRKSNQEIWDFDNIMAKKAEEGGIDVLKMWNMTVQAASWDGMRYGQKVALVQAMMVMNWLSRLPSS